MKSEILLPSRAEAEELLIWGNEQNPGPWIDHCRTVGRAAEAIAHKSGLDTERAYVSGLLHDIGYHEYRNGKGKRTHIYAGYEFMMKKGYKDIAGICLSHSFPYPHQNINSTYDSDRIGTDEEIATITAFLSEAIYNDYDRLVQLCDALCTTQITIMEKRFVDVTRRHGFKDFTIGKWGAFFDLKAYFDKLCGMNIYNLFYDEITTNIFG